MVVEIFFSDPFTSFFFIVDVIDVIAVFIFILFLGLSFESFFFLSQQFASFWFWYCFPIIFVYYNFFLRFILIWIWFFITVCPIVFSIVRCELFRSEFCKIKWFFFQQAILTMFPSFTNSECDHMSINIRQGGIITCLFGKLVNTPDIEVFVEVLICWHPFQFERKSMFNVLTRLKHNLKKWGIFLHFRPWLRS